MEKQIKLYASDYTDLRTYLLAALFVTGNIALPQLCHLMTLGGPTWLPIYFFTLVGAYKYGWRVGLLTALLSPLVNSLIFGMPLMSSVFVITVKSVFLAIFAGLAASKYQKATLLLLIGVVLSYQVAGSLVEWMVKTDFYAAVQDFRIGIPGMIVQVFGGWIMINNLIRK